MNIHIATSVDLGTVVRRGLRNPVCFVSDNWLVGPCASDPEMHARARCDFWGLEGRERSRFLKSFDEMMKALDSDQPAVVWMSRFGSDTVALWALCAWRLLYSPKQPQLELVVLGGPSEADDPIGVGGGFIRATPAEARRSLDDARPLSMTRVQEMARCWRKVAGRSPILSAESVRAGPGREELVDLGTYQAAFFPRFDRHALALSRFDELLFSCLEKQWLRPADVIVSRQPAGEELRHKWLSLTGDIFVFIRLAQWAKHNGDDAALMSEPHQPEDIVRGVRYRLSDRGDAIKRNGLTELAQGAPLPVWGATAYDPATPWVVMHDDRGHQRIQQLG